MHSIHIAERIRREVIVLMVLGSNPSNALLLIRCVEQCQAENHKDTSCVVSGGLLWINVQSYTVIKKWYS